MGDKKDDQSLIEAMASLTALKAAKKELRVLMKQKVSSISKEAVQVQSMNESGCPGDFTVGLTV